MTFPSFMMTLQEIANSISGAQIHGPADLTLTGISTDTRNIPAGCLFFALRGERFDAHDFISEALASGAKAIVSERPLDPSVPHVRVKDTRLALGATAKAWRNRFNIPVIAVTGSNGKTTVTQMLATILATASGEDQRLATRGNLNNDIGLPLTLFRMNSFHQRAVLELGMNHPGEIRYLADIAQPTVALVNNAQREHQEFMGTVEATAHENGASISALPASGHAVFPADDACAPIWRALAKDREVLDFGFMNPARIRAAWRSEADGMILTLDTPEGRIEPRLALAGAHNAHNATAAATAALAAGVSLGEILSGLESFRPVAGRGVILRSTQGATLIDDSYNANPDSVLAAIDLLASRPSPAYLILGDMGEVGEKGPEFHAEVGHYAKSRALSGLMTMGSLARHASEAFGTPHAHHFESLEALLDRVKPLAVNGTTLLVKGSRFMKMERVIEALSGTPTATH
jgi:UDP-N-acetylmuramoyl-tripeptide--D-alanyl-D-alanine ligase